MQHAARTPILALLCSVALGCPLAAQSASARLIHLTVDGKANGAPLFPGFRTHSVWSGLGVSSRGDVYVAVSNHYQPGGNVAICKYDPVADQLTALGDLQGVSTAAQNWMANESQHKVHTFLLQHADGRLYFASDDYAPSPFLRGAHVYTIDPATDKITDFSKTQPFLLDRTLNVVTNPGLNAVRSGVFVEYYGIKGMSLNARAPGVMYAMTYPEGHVIRYDMQGGGMQVIGRSIPVSYVCYTDNAGNLYYARDSGAGLALVKYVLATGKTVVVNPSFPGVTIGAIAPTQSGDVVYCLVADTKKVYRLDCVQDRFDEFTTLCGSNWWMLFNLSLSPDGRSLYYVSNNNARSTIQKVDIATKQCTEVLDVNTLLGTRDLCFGGVNVWDHAGNLYAPVWTSPDVSDVALLQVTTGERPLRGSPATLSLATGGTQQLGLDAGPDNAGRLHFVIGSAGGTLPGFAVNGLRIPLQDADVYFAFTLANPNSTFLPNSVGMLDAAGSATVSFRLPAGLPPSLVGLKLHHAFVALDPARHVVFASNAEPVSLVR